MTTPIQIRPYEPGDEVSILDAWNRIFPEQDGLEPRDLGYWAWQYRDNPLRSTQSILALDGNRVVGQYACVPLAAVDEGEPITIGLVSDAFVLPEYRRRGERPGLIIHLARALHDSYCGSGARLASRGHSLLYGYPFPIWRIAQRYLSSEMVRDMDVLFRELQAPGFTRLAPVPGVVVERLEKAGAAGDSLWDTVKDEIRFGLKRDGAWLDWRYAEHPVNEYRIFLARDEADGRPRGLAVTVLGRYVTDGAAILCDWLVPREDKAAEDALLHAVEAQALEDQAIALLAIFPQNEPRFLSFQTKGFLVAPPSHFLVMNSFHRHVRYL
ncbi:MAG: GNAT family N-acetyltransferase, partial [Planctomycetota bacterium]